VVLPLQERRECRAEATYRRSRWCLYGAKVSKGKRDEEGGGRRENGGNAVNAQYTGHHIATQPVVGELTKIDADGTVVDLVSHIGDRGRVVFVRRIGDDGR
jgi:hypothetical protein